MTNGLVGFTNTLAVIGKKFEMDKIIRQLYIFVLKRKAPIDKLHVVNGNVARRVPSSVGTIQEHLCRNGPFVITYNKPSDCLSKIKKIWENYSALSSKRKLEEINGVFLDVSDVLTEATNYYEAAELDPYRLYDKTDKFNNNIFEYFSDKIDNYSCIPSNTYTDQTCLAFEKIMEQIMRCNWFYNDDICGIRFCEIDGLVKGKR